MEAELGMRSADANWNGITLAYEVGIGDNFSFEPENSHKGDYEVDLPLGMDDHIVSDIHAVQFLDLVSSRLPPFKTSTGLHTPDGPNPYLDQRDASYVYNADHHPSSEARGESPPDQWAPNGVPFDAFPPDDSTKFWKLGTNDLMSMFNDYFHRKADDYLATLDNTVSLYQLETAQNYEKGSDDLESCALCKSRHIVQNDSWLAGQYHQIQGDQ